MDLSQIPVDKVLDNEIIIEFINGLKLNKENKEKIIKALPSFNNEEKVFLWKTLLDIWRLDREEEISTKMLEDYGYFEEENKKGGNDNKADSK